MVYPLIYKLHLTPCQLQVLARQTLVVSVGITHFWCSFTYRTVDQSALVVYIACDWYSGSATGLRRVP
jgi:hypothetical protein